MDLVEGVIGIGKFSKPSSENGEEFFWAFIKLSEGRRQGFQQLFDEYSLSCRRNGSLQEIKEVRRVFHTLKDLRLLYFKLPGTG